MVIDIADGTDPSVISSEVADLRASGGDPIIVYGMSNALGHVVDRIKQRAGGYGMITILRFFGHGAPGIMGIAGGSGPDMSRHLADLGGARRRRTVRSRAEHWPYFAPNGRVELHGCNVGQGRAGRRLLQSMAQTLGVPLSAGVRTQLAGGASNFRFEGPVRTAYPFGRIRKTGWRNLPRGYSGV